MAWQVRPRMGSSLFLSVVVTATLATQVGAASASPVSPRDVSPQQAGDALAASVTVDQAKAALLTIFSNGGIAVSDGSGASADAADVVIPAWMVDGFANAQVAGLAITVAQNAKIFDSFSRWTGGDAVSAAQFATFLKTWYATPIDPQQGYVLAAIKELGTKTDPPVDVDKGVGPDDALPLIMLLEEQVLIAALDSGSGPPGLRAPSHAITEGMPSTPCGMLFFLKEISEKSEKAQTALKALGQVGEDQSFVSGIGKQVKAFFDKEFGLDPMSTVEKAGEAAGEEGPAAAELAGVLSEQALLAAINGIIQDALKQGHLNVTFKQDPNPVTAHEQGDAPNIVTATFTFKASSDMPKEQTDCLKVMGAKFPDVDVPDPSQPYADADVEIYPGANFAELLSLGSDYIQHRNGHYTTDQSGSIYPQFETRPQKLPKDRGSPQLEDAMVNVTAHVSDLSWKPTEMSAAIFDHIDPWDNDYAIRVQRREDRAITIKGSFDMDALILGVRGSLDIHSCDGFDGYFNGTLHVEGGYENGADTVVSGVTGLPAKGSTDLPVAVHVPTTEKSTRLSPGKPTLGVITTLAKGLGIKFVDEHTAELTSGGTPMFNIQTGQVYLFPVTEGASQCPHQ